MSVLRTKITRGYAAIATALSLLSPLPAQAQAQSSPAASSTPDAPSEDGSRSGRPFENGLEGRARRPPGAGERVVLSLEDGDLMDLVRMMTRITGRRFLLTGTQRTLRATIASTEPVTTAEAWQVFLAILHQNGMTAVRRGRHYLVTDADDIERRPTPVVREGGTLPAGEAFVTWVHHIEHVPVADVAQILEALRSAEGLVLTYAPTSTLVLIDTGANIRRMRGLLREIDVARGDAHVWIEPLHFADAEQTAEQITAIFEQTATPSSPAGTQGRAPRAARATPTTADEGATAVGGGGEPALLRVIPEPRTNALVVVATEAGYRRVIALLRELDREDGARATVHVHRLQHGDSANVATTLQSLLGQTASSGTGAAQAGPAVAGLHDRVRVESHADLNALVVTCTPSDWRTVQQLVSELDAAPRQVFLEMVVMELTVDSRDELGINILSGLADILGTGAVGLVTGGGAAAEAADLLSGLAFGITGDVVVDSRLPGGSAPTFGVMLNALASSNHANIISTPHVLALDNREANINIGQSVPLQGSSVPSIPSFLTGASGTDATATAQAVSAMSGGGGRRDTGTIVAVTPHVNDDGEIRLEIRAEDSRQAGVSEGNLAAATFNQSIAETELVARDGETVVIGGLMRESAEMVRTGVPVLSEIPILGALFGSTEQRTIKRNLLFFVTPYVVRGPADLRAIFERRLRERRELLDRHRVFGDGEWEPPVDWARTRGLVGEILDRFAELDAEQARAIEPPAAPPEHRARPPLDLDPADPALEGEPLETADVALDP